MAYTEEVTFFAAIDGMSMEHMVRHGKFDMKVKHFHTEYEIFYILDGVRLFFFNNRNFLASKGDLILVDSNLIHMTKSVMEDDIGHNRIILYITLEKMKELDGLLPNLNFVQFIHENYGVYHLNEQQQQQFMDLYYLFKKEYREKKHGYQQAIELAVTSYLLNLTRDLTPETKEHPVMGEDERYQHVYKIADFLQKHCEEDITLDQLSQKFYLSKYYICRLFKEITGYSIREYININRIQKAKRLLEETDLSISDISRMVGYTSLTYFEQIFKAQMNNMSPMKYRKEKNLFISTAPLMNP